MARMIARRRTGGFTLIEIMVVVLIIGILLAIALPVFSKARETARTKSCIKNLRQIDDAKDQYAMENKLSDGAAANLSDLIPQYLRATPLCPSGGTYTCNPIGTAPWCSIAGHEL